MPYYQGDFYGQGDWYRGDPGIGSFFKKVVGIGAGLIPGIGGLLGRGASRTIPRALPAAAGVATTGIVRRAGTALGAGAQSVGRIISKHPVISAAGAAGAIGALAGREEGMLGMVPKGLRGFHVSRKTGRMVRNRRMRVTNPRALRRAIRRTTGFAKLAMRTIHLVHPRKKARFGGFKKRRASAVR